MKIKTPSYASFIGLLAGLYLSVGYCQTLLDSSQRYFEPNINEILQLPVAPPEESNVSSNISTGAYREHASLTTITQQQLKLSGARTLSEALMFFVPGYFAVEDQDDIIAGFRGLAPDNNSKVLLLFNGQNMNTEFFWGPPDAILNSPNLEYIEKIEVIRGPGSVTLGQGALLGVINIVTKDAKDSKNLQLHTHAQAGNDGFWGVGLQVKAQWQQLKFFSHIAQVSYLGQALRPEGWVILQGNQGWAGGKVADMGHRLRRIDNLTMINQIQYKNWDAQIHKIKQKRDLYNFYRDREVILQDLTAVNISYQKHLGLTTRNTTSFSFINDEYGLQSLSGVVMGGTAEQRYGLKTLFNVDNLLKNNKTAIGAEVRLFAMGLPNSMGNNFIANKIGSFNPATANQELTMVYRRNIELFSLFLENLYAITPQIDLFAAVRFDKHPFWGQNLSPRLGLIYNPNKQIYLRASYQAGFRGAVGLHYSGGYRNDGFLRADNYSAVNQSNIPNAQNIDLIRPERMSNTEIAVRWQINDKTFVTSTLFYNTISQIIDVGVFYQDPAVFRMVNIGTDIPGDWNGYWFFKNTPGTFSQIGVETIAQYGNQWGNVTLSHAFVKVQRATTEQKELAERASSMYLANHENRLYHKAYPESVWRGYISLKPHSKWQTYFNMLYYSDWYSPIGTVARGGLQLNCGVGFQLNDKVEFTLTLKNLTDNRNLYPMNSNAGGPDVSPGTAGWESRTFWLTLRAKTN
ncbi:MAG: TonB-dependent receptor [Microscillaceae bacterium]|nr:TonB-dependent receptor [Microscillaceae bacterium]MDW8461935.1 TonB-dependent receptor [Cytophagales bacterium]